MGMGMGRGRGRGRGRRESMGKYGKDKGEDGELLGDRDFWG
jgi:hypothetical protein